MHHCLLVATLSVTLCVGNVVGQNIDKRPDGKGIGTLIRHVRGSEDGSVSTASLEGSNGITYHGGPVMLGTTKVYFIWYGNWSNNTAPMILADFASNISGSPYFNINTTYDNGAKQWVTNSVFFAGSTTDRYSQGPTLSDGGVQSVVTRAISGGAFPNDPNGVYFVLSSADVDESSGFCSLYCAWHAHAAIGGNDIKYGFVGNTDRCPSACQVQPTAASPNNNQGADGMANLIAHELQESITDPDLNAWYDSQGSEISDKCAWSFGTTAALPTGALYNITLGIRQYLIQRNWVNASGGYCTMSYAPKSIRMSPVLGR